MDVYDALARRRTVRDFSPRPMAADVLTRILEAGLLAPSHNHLREWHYVVVDDATLRSRLVSFFARERTEEELRALLDDWNMTDERQFAMYFDAVPKQVSMILSAAALVLPCFRQRGDLLGAKQSLHELNAFASIWAVLENVLVAAASEGIFGVTKIMTTPEESEHVRRTLDIPDGFEIPCYLALGYPRGGPAPFQQIPVDIAQRMHRDTWRNGTPRP